MWLTYNDVDYEHRTELRSVIYFGKDICKKYLVTLYKQYISNNNNKYIRFSEWKSLNKNIVTIYEKKIQNYSM